MNSSIAQDYPEIPINILLIFGIPGSGKSFTAQKIKKRLTKDGHICFILDYDLLESQNPEKILEAEGKNLLELFEQQAVYLYNKSDSGNTEVKQMAVVSKKGKKRSSIFLFDKPEEDLQPPQVDPKTGQALGGRKSRFFL